ncbi:MAG: aromatic amino acid lyase [Pseudomonadota bacterium]
MTEPVKLDGRRLSAKLLSQIADGSKVSIADSGLQKMQAARKVVEKSIAEGARVYGVTTGLGSNVSKTLSAEELSSFSLQTLRGRAQALGKPLDSRVVRAAMAARLNSLLVGASGASSQCADILRDSLNAHITPVVGETASIGAGDLIWGATMGLALCGEGKMDTPLGRMDAAQALSQSGIEPFVPGPRDGIALANHAGFSSALAALGITEFGVLLENLQCVSAVSLEAFGANLSPFRSDVLSLCMREGEIWAAEGILSHLHGSALLDSKNARRLQDPLSLRNIAQVHGAAYSTMTFANDIVARELNSASDNPVVIVDRFEMVSSGGYHTTQLGLVVEMLARALVPVATLQLARMSKLVSNRFTDLPQYLAAPGSDSNGFAPLLKSAEATCMEAIQVATPVPQWPSISADGVEDSLTSAPLAGKSLLAMLKNMRRLTAIECVIAAQALEMRREEQAGANVASLLEKIREHVAPLSNDRPLAAEIEALTRVLNDPLSA